MIFPVKYKCLNKNDFTLGEFKIIPIRFEDRFDIMKWRNEQIYHLRQKKCLTSADQENYFKKTVSLLFEQEKPNQILFSFFKNDVLIGYGGLVHINWLDNNLEMSFLINTEILNNDKDYNTCFTAFISLIKEVAFNEMKFNKLFTETYDLRDKHVRILENNGFILEGVLRKHIFFENKYYNSLCHSILLEEYVD